MNWYILGFKRCLDFNGRSRRKEYWFFALFNFIAAILLAIIDGITNTYNAEIGMGLLGIIYALVTIIPNISITFRRLHDTDKSAWWLLILLLPLIGVIVLIVFLCQDSKESNQYGASPKLAELQPT